MLIKQADDSSEVLQALEALAGGTGPESKRAATELRIRKAGLRGERDAAYLIDFDFAGSPNWAVVHDLRLEHGGRVAQIDHLLINRWMQVYVLETKHFHAGVKITEDGEFLRWNDFGKRYEGMPSPLAQNDRHIGVLQDVFSTLDLPTRAGFRISPEFITLVLVSPSSRIDRPKRFDASRVIKADVLKKTIWKDIDSENSVIGMLKTAAKIISGDTVREVAKALAAKHRPVVPQRGQTPTAPTPAPAPLEPAPASARAEKHVAAPSTQSSAGPSCKACRDTKGEILYGKFGYYFKCGSCSANTAIRFKCEPGHSPRLRKDGNRFFRDCEQCGASSIYFINGGAQ